jgi:hypothetical protein
MSLEEEYVRVCQMMSDITAHWPLVRMSRDALRKLEECAFLGDRTAVTLKTDLEGKLRSITKPEDFEKIAAALEVYAEALTYKIISDRGVALERTPGTGQFKIRRPDFVHKATSGEVYFEVKCIDFQGGTARHKVIADDALEMKADLAHRAKKPGIHFGYHEISTFERPSGPADRIDLIIDKALSNINRDQISLGATVLVLDLGRIEPEAHHPCSLLPVYYDSMVKSCVSGELWHIASGQIGNMIYCIPEFEGKTNIDRPLERNGILHEHPQLAAIAFLLNDSQAIARIFTVLNNSMQTSALVTGNIPTEFELEKIIYDISDARNDTHNTYQSKYVCRT